MKRCCVLPGCVRVGGGKSGEQEGIPSWHVGDVAASFIAGKEGKHLLVLL